MTAAEGLGAGQIPAYGKGSLPPNIAEAEGFLDDVDDVARLIEAGGLLKTSASLGGASPPPPPTSARAWCA